MAVAQAFIETLCDLLAPLGHIAVRRMFGGAALYCDGQVFALVDDDVLYLKVDAQTRADFEAEGCGPFTYPMQGIMKAMPAYHRAPDRLLDDVDDLQSWARRAVAVGHRAHAAKAAGKRPVKAANTAVSKSAVSKSAVSKSAVTPAATAAGAERPRPRVQGRPARRGR